MFLAYKKAKREQIAATKLQAMARGKWGREQATRCQQYLVYAKLPESLFSRALCYGNTFVAFWSDWQLTRRICRVDITGLPNARTHNQHPQLHLPLHTPRPL